jgi:hypothetical protein
MEIKRRILERYLNYDPDEDFNGSQGLKIADEITRVFGSQESLKRYQKTIEGEVKSQENSDKENKYKEILNLYPKRVLLREMNRTKFKGIFGRLKKEGYIHSDGKEMKNYNRMSNSEMWNYYNKISSDLNLTD